MSNSTSTASSVWSAGTRVQKTVTSLSVDAFITPPTPSIASAMSLALGRRGVPLKKRCSTKWDTPPMRSSSNRPDGEHQDDADRRAVGQLSGEEPGPSRELVAEVLRG